MPWKESDVMRLREEFVLRALSRGNSFARLCREYGISRKTGYKWKERFLADGIGALRDQSRRPLSCSRSLDEACVCELIRFKNAHPTWGPKKIRELYRRTHAQADLASLSSVKRVLERAGLVMKRRRRKSRDCGALRSDIVPRKPNDLWTVDFKGWWYSAEGSRCEPLTVRDASSRYVLCASALDDARSDTVRARFEELFELHGLPKVIRSDNGSPFACTRAVRGLSRLSVWWLALGIDLDRIEPGRPDQNGAHERMHRDLALEVQRSAVGPLEEQRAALEIWRRTYNEERPHEALGMRCPAQLYRNSPRPFEGTPETIDYPPGRLVRKVTTCGTIRLHGIAIGISRALSGWQVALRPGGPGRYMLSFADLPLGIVDLGSETFHPEGALERCAP